MQGAMPRSGEEHQAGTWTELGSRVFTGRGERLGPFRLVAVVLSAALLLALGVHSWSARTTDAAARRASTPVGALAESAWHPTSPHALGAPHVPTHGRLHRALGWLGGLASRLILPSDVTDRLRAQDPRLAAIVVAAWSDLNGR